MRERLPVPVQVYTTHLPSEPKIDKAPRDLARTCNTIKQKYPPPIQRKGANKNENNAITDGGVASSDHSLMY